MPDSMSKTEIEDVLSSIRRLVTEDHGPAQRPNTPPADKLVLTPALRIQPSPSDVRLSFGASEPLRLVAAQAPHPAMPPSHQAAAALEAALQGHRDDWEPDGTEAVTSTGWSVEWDATGGDEAGTSGQESRDAAAAEALQAASHLAEGAAAPAGQGAAEDDSWDDFLAEHRSAPLLAAEQADPWQPARQKGTEASGDEAGPVETASGRPAEPSAGVDLNATAEPTLEPALSDRDMDGDGEDDDSALPASAPLDLPDVRLDDGLSGPGPEEDPPSLDEALLRDLIRDVLREELQGELGERITRNVRKLVRAELARALTARDLT
jgi:hypothetical protein